MLLKVMGAALAVLLITNAVTGYLLKSAYKDIGTLEANVQTVRGALTEQRETLRLVQEEFARQVADMAELQRASNQAQIERDEAVADLNALRGKVMSASIGRPSLVGRKATNATRRLMCEVFETTGGGQGCDAPPVF